MTRDEELRSRRRARLGNDDRYDIPPALRDAVVSGRHGGAYGLVGAWIQLVDDDAKPHTEMSNYERFCGIHDRVSLLEAWLEAALDQKTLADKEADLDGLPVSVGEIRALLSWLSFCAINARDEELTVERDRERLEPFEEWPDEIGDWPDEIGDEPF